MSRLTSRRPSRATLLPTAVFDLFDRGAVRDALRDTVTPTSSVDDAVDILEVLDALGAEGMNTLHLTGGDLALAVDRDLHTSSSWLAGALFDSMDRSREAA
ncbi:MAG TPA: hypothetical protein VEA99_11755 [Gemmatimonadaceae bacterium]|nr:hypothetical protein [Gemmatimonadaceae bacterium]